MDKTYFNSRETRFSPWIALVVLLTFLIALFTSNAKAAVDEPAPPPQECKLNFATGPKGKGYSVTYSNIASMCGQQVPTCEVATSGGLDNLMALSQNTADIGLVQVDTLKDMSASDGSLANLQVVATTGFNLLHIVTLSNGFDVTSTKTVKGAWYQLGDQKVKEVSNQRIANFSDFKNVKYPVALVGTAKLMGRSLDRTYGYGLQFVDYDNDQQALNDLKAGKVWAVMTVSAWPNGALANATSSSGYTLVKFDLQPFGNYVIMKKPYPKMNVYGMPFLAVPNVLVTRPFRADGPNGRNLSALQSCIVNHMSDLKEGSYAPSWKDVDNPLNNFGLKAFVPSGTYVAPSMARKKR